MALPKIVLFNITDVQKYVLHGENFKLEFTESFTEKINYRGKRHNGSADERNEQHRHMTKVCHDTQ